MAPASARHADRLEGHHRRQRTVDRVAARRARLARGPAVGGRRGVRERDHLAHAASFSRGGAVRRSVCRALSFAAAAIPFAFASIRAVQTGRDFRYFWLAIAGSAGAAATARLGSAYNTSRSSRLTVAAAAFVAAALLSTVVAMMNGTRLGPGLIVVAASFAACFA